MTRLPKDIFNICLSYFTDEEIIYSEKQNWDKFEKDKICNIAAVYGWLDLLIWAREKNYPWNVYISIHTAENGHSFIKMGNREWL